MEDITEGTIVLQENLESADRIVIKDGQKIVLDMNGYSLCAASGYKKNDAFVRVTPGGELTITGHGFIDAGLGNTLGLFGTDFSGSGKVSKLTVENGTFQGWGYCLTGNATSDANTTEVVINGGAFKALQASDGVAFYHPQVGKATINSGEFIGSTGLEVRAGEVTINDGYFEGRGAFSMVPMHSGATSTGCGIAVAQHDTKKPIAVTVNNGMLKGVRAFHEGNPQGNDEAATSQIKLALNGGHYLGDYVTYETISSETQTHFVDGENTHYSYEIKADYLK